MNTKAQALQDPTKCLIAKMLDLAARTIFIPIGIA